MEMLLLMVGFTILCVILRVFIIGKMERRREDRFAKKIAEELKKSVED